MIKFTADIDSVPFKRVMTNGRRRYNDPKYTAFKNHLGLIATQAMEGREPMIGSVSVTVAVYKPKPRPTSRNYGDIDNHLKSVLDALNGIAYVDDSQVTEAHAELLNGDARIEITLEELE